MSDKFLFVEQKNRNLKGNMMIRKLMRKDFDSVFQIIEASFPEDEYRTYDEQKALLNNKAYEVYIVPDSDDNTIKAFIAVWKFDSFVFIEHFAVNPPYRNNGVGSEFLRKFVCMQEKMVCLEVEPPDNEMAFRRIGFYKRNNFFLNMYPYTQPPISTGKNPVHLLIMTYGQYINNMEFAKIKKEIFTQVYKQS